MRPGHGHAPFVLACAILASIAIIVGQALMRGAAANNDATSATAASVDTQETEAHSTPVAEWRQGEVPALYQIDPTWADKPYAGGDIRENGCGPTCLSMVYVALTGHTDLDPAAMARFSEEQGHVADNMTAWTLMTDGAAALGLNSEELPADADTIRSALAAGKPVICSVRPGDFTKTGHFIVLSGTHARRPDHRARPQQCGTHRAKLESRAGPLPMRQPVGILPIGQIDGTDYCRALT